MEIFRWLIYGMSRVGIVVGAFAAMYVFSSIVIQNVPSIVYLVMATGTAILTILELIKKK